MKTSPVHFLDTNAAIYRLLYPNITHEVSLLSRLTNTARKNKRSIETFNKYCKENYVFYILDVCVVEMKRKIVEFGEHFPFKSEMVSNLLDNFIEHGTFKVKHVDLSKIKDYYLYVFNEYKLGEVDSMEIAYIKKFPLYSLFISVDKRLVKASKKEGLNVWNFFAESFPRNESC